MMYFFVYRESDGDGENYLEKFGTLDKALAFLSGKMHRHGIQEFQLIQGEQLPIENVRGAVRIVPDAAPANGGDAAQYRDASHDAGRYWTPPE